MAVRVTSVLKLMGIVGLVGLVRLQVADASVTDRAV